MVEIGTTVLPLYTDSVLVWPGLWSYLCRKVFSPTCPPQMTLSRPLAAPPGGPRQHATHSPRLSDTIRLSTHCKFLMVSGRI